MKHILHTTLIIVSPILINEQNRKTNEHLVIR